MRNVFVAVLLCVLSASTAMADVKVSGLFTSHMVLQREKLVPIWGDAAPGEKVTVKFRNQEKSATADDKGKWQVKIDALTAGGPDKLTIAGNNTIEIEDVLVGEVWIGSGQSNMAGWVKEYTNNNPELAEMALAAPYPQIRLFGMPGNWQVYATGRWQLANTTNTANFSAALMTFGARLKNELGVPVGLIVAAASGSVSAKWVSKEALKNDKECQEIIEKFKATIFDQAAAQKRYDDRVAERNKMNEKLRSENKPEQGPPCGIEVPGEVYCSETGTLYESYLRPLIPFAFRGVVWDQGESGTGLIGVPDQSDMMRLLISSWRKAWGQGDFPFIYMQKPSGEGCGWEKNRYADRFDPLPERASLDPGEMPVFLRIMKNTNTFMAITSDLGGDQHPTNKFGYASRAFEVAKATVYGKKNDYYGPMYESHTVDGDKVRVHFTHVGKGLTFRQSDKLQGFAIAGADNQFQWADAVIDGDTVVLSNAKVSKPVTIRYAWSLKRSWANLFNKDGLPAVPFNVK